MNPKHGWTCPDCGAVNECTDFTCECVLEAERREAALLERLDRLLEEMPASERRKHLHRTRP